MHYLWDRYILIFESYNFTYSELEVIAASIFLSFLLGTLPLRQPLLWKALQKISAFFYKRLNRKDRSPHSRKIRGWIVCVFFLISSFFIVRFIQRFETTLEIKFIIETIILSLSLSSSSVWKSLLLTGKKRPHKKTAYVLLAPLVQEDIPAKDSFAQNRLWITYTAKSLERFFISPLLYYALFGLYGLVPSITLSALKFSCSYRNSYSEIFAKPINIIDSIVHFIPARLSALLTIITTLLCKGCYSSLALKTVSSQAQRMNGINTGWTIAAYAGALNLTLAGPSTQETLSTDQPWIGPKGSSAKIQPHQLKKALLLHFTTITLSFLIVLTLLVF